MRAKKINTSLVSQTAGLTSIEQLADSTANDIFSFKESTSQTEDILATFSAPYQEHKQGCEE